ncbi:MAG: hypothetical protein HYS23_15965 [Geobacter sp.]|nr:hypothetical protein [Geobacter sp.]
MDDYIWLFQRESKRDLVLSVVASLFLHLAMIVVMTTTSIFIPRIGKSQELDIFWLYPPFLYGSPKPVHPSLPRREIARPENQMAFAPPQPPEKKPVIEPPRVKEPPPPPAPVEIAKPEPPAKSEMVYPVAEKPEPPPKPEQKAVVAEAPRQPEAPPEMAEKPAISETPPPEEKGGEAAPTEKGPAEPATVATETAGPPGTPAAVAGIPSPEAGTGTASASPGSEAGSITGEVGGGPQLLPPMEVARQETSEPPKPEEPAKPEQPAGIVTPPLFGDLKLVVSGKSEVLSGMGLMVKFRAYPKSRHNRPMTRTESGRFTRLVPTHARPNENTLQAVIVTAPDGIYDFFLESGAVSPVSVDFHLKLFENTGRAATRHIGTRIVSNATPIARVIMPEGVLWGDDSAFSGNLEDSDSISKFNTETGLFWKEYK